MTSLTSQPLVHTNARPSHAISLTLTVGAFCSFILLFAAAGCGSSSTTPPPVTPKWVVNSSDDIAQPPSGTLTLRGVLLTRCYLVIRSTSTLA